VALSRTRSFCLQFEPLTDVEWKAIDTACEEQGKVRAAEAERAELAHYLSDVLADDLKFEIDRALGRGYSEATIASYDSLHNAFRKFCKEQNLTAIPASSETVAFYLIHSAGEGASLKTLSHTVCAISYVNKLAESTGHRLAAQGYSLEGEPMIAAALRYIRRRHSEENPPTEKEQTT
jgi:hypothetical protein